MMIGLTGRSFIGFLVGIAFIDLHVRHDDLTGGGNVESRRCWGRWISEVFDPHLVKMVNGEAVNEILRTPFLIGADGAKGSNSLLILGPH